MCAPAAAMCAVCPHYIHTQGRISTLQASLSRAEDESERLSGLLAAAEAAAAASKGREDAARATGREYAERARRAETLLEESEAEVAEVGVRVDDGVCFVKGKGGQWAAHAAVSARIGCFTSSCVSKLFVIVCCHTDVNIPSFLSHVCLAGAPSAGGSTAVISRCQG